MSVLYLLFHTIQSLPEKLTKQLVHLVGKLLELERPSGSTWYVGLIRSGDKLVLQPGWNDFASANNVSQNDHLVFKFIGESKFQVFIFDPTGCEKGGSFEKEEQERDENLGLAVGEELSKEVHKFDIKEKDKQHEIQGEIESSILNKKKPPTEEEQGGSEASNDSIPIEELRKILNQKGEWQKVQGETKLQQPNIATKPPSKKLERNEEEDKETSKDSVPIGKLFRTKTQKNKHYREILGETETPTMKRHRPNPSNFPSTKGQEGRSLQSCYNNYTSRVQWNGQQKSTAQQLACKVQVGNPYFHQILKKYNLTSPYRMCIPRKFSADHLKRENLDFILYCPDQGKTWFVTSYFGAPRNEQMLRGPTWEKFVKDNKLQECDLCVFELVKTAKRLTFAVHISRATKILDS
ncbi:B3 domain-containing protein [Carex littledalei]|uniref:B3 domain-containing protein n=1 Tax=Carex littledalei TaxID=544730 RepID=A0A833QTP1_9POAL|nr:B3 domain-containing protein [Carex littledalei]